MRLRPQVLADIRRAILEGFEHTPQDLKLAVNEAAIGKSWYVITYQIEGLDACVDTTIQYAVQQGQLTRLLTTLSDKYNPALGPRLRQLAQELRPLTEHATTLGVRLDELESIVLSDVEFQEAGLWIERLGVIRRAVCRVEPQPESRSINGFGTGFLVEPGVVMTCHHVAKGFWNDPNARERVVFRFDYERLPDDSIATGEEYRLAEDWRIQAAAVPDYALLRVRPTGGRAEPRQPIDLSSQVVKTDRPLLILQHPSAKPLKLLFGAVNAIDDARVSYKINTAGGSSGSPCLASDLSAVAVHFAAGNRAYTIRAICGQIDQALKAGGVANANRALLGRLIAKATDGVEAQAPDATPPAVAEKKESADREYVLRPKPESPKPSLRPSSLELWREKLEFLRAEEAVVTDPEQKFAIRQRIAEAKQQIAELEADSQQPSGMDQNITLESRTAKLLSAYHADIRQRWKRRWSADGSDGRQPYIETQELSLLLETEQPQQYLHPEYFRVGRRSGAETEQRELGQWGAVDRAEIAANELTCDDASPCDLSRLVITTDAAVGKTTAMEWLETEMSQTGSPVAAFLLAFSHLPSRAEDLLPELARRLLQASGGCDEAASVEIALQVLVSLRSQGRLVLLLDALDQEPGNGSVARLVRQLLDDVAWRGCRVVISGRPHALRRHWSELFATELRYGWRFVKLEEFSPDEQRRFLGVDENGDDRIDSIPAEAHDILSTPRVLSYLRGLPDADLRTIRAAGDVYWLSVQHLLDRGMEGSEAARRIGLDPNDPTPLKVQARSRIRALELLSAIAFEMTSTRVANTVAASVASPTIPNFEGVTKNQFRRFRRHLLVRLCGDAAPAGADHALYRDLDGLSALNEFISQGYFDTSVDGLQEVFWRNRTL